MIDLRTTLSGIILGAALCSLPALCSAAESATTREYPYLYKSPRAMGMGGAYTAVGGRVDTLFYNPAGLSLIPKDKGWEVNLLNLSAEANDDGLKFYRDLQSALDTGDLNGDGSATDDQQRAVNDLLYNYSGKYIHLRVADFSSFGKSGDTLSFGAGALASGRFDALPHQGFGPEGFLEVDSDATYGALGGISIPLGSRVFAGAALKYIHRETVMHNFSAREIVDHAQGLDSYLMDDLRKTGSAVGIDAGAIWTIAPDSWWRPSLGLSVMNIGDLDMKDAGTIPMTVNAGFSINPKIDAFRSLLFAIDYVDIADNYTQDTDAAKRLRYGAELQLFDRTAFELAVRAGMYEGYPTAGLNLRFSVIALSYTFYSEEVGAYAGQDRDKRQLLNLNIGW
jgi:hypothetical protein